MLIRSIIRHRSYSVVDVQAALDVGALSLAVATGFHSRSELASHGPHWLFSDLADTAQVVAVLR
jgi:phosphoglycolate phosphatase-like HAD superfamily hydrolase